MMKFLTPIILIVIAGTVFFTLTDPLYNEVSTSKGNVSSYNEALDNSSALDKERDKLTAKYSAIDPNNLAKLGKLLPENVDNIRLILEIEGIAARYNMALKDVRYNATENKSTPAADTAAPVRGGAPTVSKDYGVFDLEFSVSGSYDDFMKFTQSLENNLRIVDIASVTFSADTTGADTKNKNAPDTYKYDYKIKTYWLKN